MKKFLFVVVFMGLLSVGVFAKPYDTGVTPAVCNFYQDEASSGTIILEVHQSEDTDKLYYEELWLRPYGNHKYELYRYKDSKSYSTGMVPSVCSAWPGVPLALEVHLSQSTGKVWYTLFDLNGAVSSSSPLTSEGTDGAHARPAVCSLGTTYGGKNYFALVCLENGWARLPLADYMAYIFTLTPDQKSIDTKHMFTRKLLASWTESISMSVASFYNNETAFPRLLLFHDQYAVYPSRLCYSPITANLKKKTIGGAGPYDWGGGQNPSVCRMDDSRNSNVFVEVHKSSEEPPSKNDRLWVDVFDNNARRINIDYDTGLTPAICQVDSYYEGGWIYDTFLEVHKSQNYNNLYADILVIGYNTETGQYQLHDHYQLSPVN